MARVCVAPCEAYKKWSLHLLGDRRSSIYYVTSVTPDTVHRVQKMPKSSLKKRWRIPLK